MRLFSDQKRLLLKTFQDTGAINGSDYADEAIATAYREIAGRHPWSYLHRRTQVNTTPLQRDGTVAYNASTNVLTLTGGTWPTWATQALIVMNQNIYAVQDILSSTTVSLVADRAPAADIASGMAYTLMQTEYVLPANFIRMEELVTVGNFWVTYEVPPGSTLYMERMFYNPARPWMYLVRGSTYFPGRMCIEFSPPPDAAYSFDISYFAQPRQRTLSGEYTTGTVSVSGTAVVGVGTTFTQSMVGCRLRQGTVSAVPVGEYGSTGSTAENTIKSVTDTTHLTLVDAGQSSSGVKFTIDDPIDVDRQSMDELFTRMCEAQFAVLTRQNNLKIKKDLVVEALNDARARDVRTSPRPSQYVVPSFEALARANLGGR